MTESPRPRAHRFHKKSDGHQVWWGVTHPGHGLHGLMWANLRTPAAPPSGSPVQAPLRCHPNLDPTCRSGCSVLGLGDPSNLILFPQHTQPRDGQGSAYAHSYLICPRSGMSSLSKESPSKAHVLCDSPVCSLLFLSAAFSSPVSFAPSFALQSREQHPVIACPASHTQPEAGSEPASQLTVVAGRPAGGQCKPRTVPHSRTGSSA